MLVTKDISKMLIKVIFGFGNKDLKISRLFPGINNRHVWQCLVPAFLPVLSIQVENRELDMSVSALFTIMTTLLGDAYICNMKANANLTMYIMMHLFLA